jgi:hypothetical protein
MKVVKLSALRTSHIYPQKIFLVPRRLSRLQGHIEADRIKSMKNSKTPPEIEPTTFWLIAQGLNKLRHSLLPSP